MKKFLRHISLFNKITKNIGIRRKKLKIATSVILANITVALDILIIKSIISIFTNEEMVLINSEISEVLNSEFSFLFLVVSSFLVILGDNYLRDLIKIQIDSYVKKLEINNLFFKNNYSISRTNYAVNIESVEVGKIYKNLIQLLISIVQFLLFLSYIIYTDFNLFSYLLVFLVVISYPLYRIRKNTVSGFQNFQISQDNMNSQMESILSNFFFFKLLNKIKNEFIAFEQKINLYRKSDIKIQLMGVINYHLPLHAALVLVGIITIVANGIQNNNLEFVLVSVRVFQTLGFVNFSIHLFRSKFPFLQNYVRFNSINSSTPKYSAEYVVNKDLKNYAVNVENLSFKYEDSDKLLFENFNLKIKKDEHTAIVGPNGIGKSSLVGLLSNVYLPIQGKIEVSTSSFGYVGSTPYILKNSLKENLVYGNPQEVSDDEMFVAIKDLEIFNGKLDIDILNREISNSTLSSGQMQKIAFARALLMNPDILFLDEALSNLDIKSKTAIQNKLKKFDKTVIQITHTRESINVDTNIISLSQDDEGKVYINNS